jgi:hypothetical protein
VQIFNEPRQVFFTRWLARRRKKEDSRQYQFESASNPHLPL